MKYYEVYPRQPYGPFLRSDLMGYPPREHLAVPRRFRSCFGCIASVSIKGSAERARMLEEARLYQIGRP